MAAPPGIDQPPRALWQVTLAVEADRRCRVLKGMSTVQDPHAAALDVLDVLWPGTEWDRDWQAPSGGGGTGGELTARPADDVPALPGWTVRVEVSAA